MSHYIYFFFIMSNLIFMLINSDKSIKIFIFSLFKWSWRWMKPYSHHEIYLRLSFKRKQSRVCRHTHTYIQLAITQTNNDNDDDSDGMYFATADCFVIIRCQKVFASILLCCASPRVRDYTKAFRKLWLKRQCHLYNNSQLIIFTLSNKRNMYICSFAAVLLDSISFVFLFRFPFFFITIMSSNFLLIEFSEKWCFSTLVENTRRVRKIQRNNHIKGRNMPKSYSMYSTSPQPFSNKKHKMLAAITFVHCLEIKLLLLSVWVYGLKRELVKPLDMSANKGCRTI